MKLQAKFMLIVGSLIALITALTLYITTYLNINASIELGKTSLETITDATVNSADLWLSEKRILLQSISRHLEFSAFLTGESDGQDARSLLDNYNKSSHDFENLEIANIDGQIVMDIQNIESMNLNVSELPLWQEMKQNTSFFYQSLSPMISSETQKPVFTMIQGITSPDGTFQGAVIMTLDWEKFVDTQIRSIKIKKSGYISITNSQCQNIAHPDSSLFLKDLSELSFIKKIITEKKGIQEYEFNEKLKFMAFRPLQNAPWIISATIEKNELLEGVYHSRNMAVMIGCLLMLFVVLGVTITVKKTIINKIDQILAIISRAEQGDLQARIELNTQDEVGKIAYGFNDFIIQLAGGVRDIKNISNHLAAALFEITSTSEQLSINTESTTGQINTIAGAITELNSNVNEITNSTEVVRQQAGDNQRLAEESSSQNIQLQRSIQNLLQQEKAFVKDIERLNDQSNQITSIVQVIEDIADQTNLLALNAAIEAARAGEHGRGFAVVADEVRKLAEKTQNSTKEISTMVGEIRQNMQKAVGTITKNMDIIQKVDMDVQLSAQSNEKVKSSSHQTLELIKHISQALIEQKRAMDQMLENVEQINRSSMENNTGLGEIVRTIVEIQQTSEQLLTFTHHYQLEAGTSVDSPPSETSHHKNKKMGMRLVD